MIINIRGTNGAGKSTLVRKVMERYQTITQIEYPAEIKGRKGNRKIRPMGYLCATDVQRLFIPGHYEIANGGVDTIHNLEYAYKLILEHHSWGANVLYEGMNWHDSVKTRLLVLHECLDVHVIFIKLPLACHLLLFQGTQHWSKFKHGWS
jgi:hypothetical protein